MWADSSQAGRIGIQKIEDYITREEKQVVQERLCASANTLGGIVEKPGKCVINENDQEFGSAGPGKSWAAAEAELRSALKAVQDYRKSEKSAQSDDDPGVLEGDVVDGQAEEGRSAWIREGGNWDLESQVNCNEDFHEIWDEQMSRTQNERDDWIDDDEAGHTGDHGAGQD